MSDFYFGDIVYTHPNYDKPSDVKHVENHIRYEYPDGVVLLLNIEGPKMFFESNYGFETTDGKNFKPNLNEINTEFEDII